LALSAKSGRVDQHVRPYQRLVSAGGKTVAGRWRDLDRRPENLTFETFATSGNREPQPFTVNPPHLGVEIRVLENESILDASRRSNVGVLFDCLRGECGLCALPVLALNGEIDHRDVFLSEAERKDGSSAPAY
jgi:ferredoxin